MAKRQLPCIACRAMCAAQISRETLTRDLSCSLGSSPGVGCVARIGCSYTETVNNQPRLRPPNVDQRCLRFMTGQVRRNALCSRNPRARTTESPFVPNRQTVFPGADVLKTCVGLFATAENQSQEINDAGKPCWPRSCAHGEREEGRRQSGLRNHPASCSSVLLHIFVPECRRKRWYPRSTTRDRSTVRRQR